MSKRGLSIALVLVLTLGLVWPGVGAASGGGWASGAVFNLAGARNYKLWVPENYDGEDPVPLVVALHGCTQDAEDFAVGTQFNELADEEGFLVVYPEQPFWANPNKCWNFPLTSNQSRGSGEPSLIAAVVNKVRRQYNVDEERIYVFGASAGGAMAAIMGATYPDLFAAIGIASGAQYKVAENMLESFPAMWTGGPDPDVNGVKAYQAMGQYARPMRVFVIHGSDDSILFPIAGHKALSQWAQTNDLIDDGQDNDSVNDTPDQTVQGQVPGGHSYTQYIYYDADDEPIMEKWIVNGMGHAWSGGSTAGSYTDPDGPDATAEMWRFFAAGTNGGTVSPPYDPNDDTPPTLSVSPGGGNYDGLAQVALELDEAGTIYYTTDGSDPTTSGTRSSFSDNGQLIFWSNTTLKVYGVDLAGNASDVETHTYTIAAATTATFNSYGPQDGYTKSFGPGSETGAYYSQYDIRVGDSFDTPMRGVLSFDTSSIPSGATILWAELQLTQSSTVFGRPFTALGAMVADIKHGCLGWSCGLVASDFQAAPSMYEAAAFDAGVEVWGVAQGNVIRAPLKQDALAYINKSGRTQFKLRFQSLNNNNYLHDGVEFYTGGNLNPSYRPKLMVIYK